MSIPGPASDIGFSDEGLVREFQQGSPEAFEKLYRLHRARVVAVARRYLRDERDVEEAVQDTFLKAFKALPRFNGSFRTSAWLARIAVNTAIDISRKNSRRPEVALVQGEEGDPVAGVDEIVVGSGRDVNAALEQIPVPHARALRLRALYGASHQEIAEELGGTPSQAKGLLHRARQTFKSAWRGMSSGAAFFLGAGAVAISIRVSRAVGGVAPVAAGVQSAPAGVVEVVAGPVLGSIDLSSLL